ncbi:S1 RNA-binding domain-containing protein [Ruminococcaceae bacterium OttesenSCG-928-N02]|nr:S1 RNA-binding domain-containing protein [Ruminococcaceae bacterium OttesenSCG-928-N02]
MCYLPEGYEKEQTVTAADIQSYIEDQKILTGYATSFGNNKVLYAKLGAYTVEIPFEELALGFAQGSGKEVSIISRIGSPVSFVLTGRGPNGGTLYASRATAQTLCYTHYLNKCTAGDIIPCIVTHIEPFGAFCDIGCGISALLPIDCISISRIQSPADRISVGQKLMCVIKNRDEMGRFVLTLKELLGTWQENAVHFTAGSTVVGTVRTVESYGIFVELAPNLTGLAESFAGVYPGDSVSIYIKSITPQKMKIKLIILKKLTTAPTPGPLPYVLKEGHIARWQYSPAESLKLVETVFEE